MFARCSLALILCALCSAQGPPFSKDQFLHLIGSVQMVEEERIVDAVKTRGVSFAVDDSFRKLLKRAEVSDALVAALLHIPLPEAGSLPPPLDPPHRAEWLEGVQRKALYYALHLPNFNCLQVTYRQEDLSRKANWNTLDVIEAQVAYDSEKGESYQFKKGKAVQGGAVSTGEFGSMAVGVFSPVAQAKFEWAGQALVRGRATEVFDYSVRKVDSKWLIEYSGDGRPPGSNRRPIPVKGKTMAGYRGRVWLDRSTQELLRISMIAVDLPPDFPIRAAGTVVDYDYADLSGNKFLLPKRAVVLMEDAVPGGTRAKRNQIDFSQYRKFTTETKISFDPPQGS